MKKLVILFFALALLLAGCVEDETLVGGLPAEFESHSNLSSEANLTDTSGDTTPPDQIGTSFLKAQTYYNASGDEIVRMNVSLNDDDMPETILINSGKDVTHTIFYDDSGVITGFRQIESLYAEDTITLTEVNERGDVISHTTDAASDKESTVYTTYVYNDQGLIVQKNQVKNGASYYSETRHYDDNGNLLIRDGLYSNNDHTKLICHYENGFLVNTEETVNGTVKETVTYKYDNQGNLVEMVVNNVQTYTYTYNEKGVLKKLIRSKNNSKSICECDDYGRILLQYNYTDGSPTSKIVYEWAEFKSEPTESQLKVFDQLGIVLNVYSNR